MFDKLLKYKGNSHKKMNIGKNPDIDWLILLSVLFIMVICFLIYSTSLFINVTNSQDEVTLTEINRPNLNTVGMGKVITEYGDKKLQFEDKTKKVEIFTDPSI